jgi:hypothetical protein
MFWSFKFAYKDSYHVFFFFVFFMWKGIEIWFLETKKALSLSIPVRNLLNLYLIERLLYLEC